MDRNKGLPQAGTSLTIIKAIIKNNNSPNYFKAWYAHHVPPVSICSASRGMCTGITVLGDRTGYDDREKERTGGKYLI